MSRLSDYHKIETISSFFESPMNFLLAHKMPHLLYSDGLGSLFRPRGKQDVAACICDSSTPVKK